MMNRIDSEELTHPSGVDYDPAKDSLGVYASEDGVWLWNMTTGEIFNRLRQTNYAQACAFVVEFNERHPHADDCSCSGSPKLCAAVSAPYLNLETKHFYTIGCLCTACQEHGMAYCDLKSFAATNLTPTEAMERALSFQDAIADEFAPNGQPDGAPAFEDLHKEWCEDFDREQMTEFLQAIHDEFDGSFSPISFEEWMDDADGVLDDCSPTTKGAAMGVLVSVYALYENKIGIGSGDLEMILKAANKRFGVEGK